MSSEVKDNTDSLDIPLYVWTANGTIQELIPRNKSVKKTSHAIEGFDNLRRTTSSRGQFIEIPSNNLIKTRSPIDTQPLFRFTVLPNRKYKLFIAIRAKTSYKYKLPVFARYYIKSPKPNVLSEYSATYVSSNETAMESEKKSFSIGSAMEAIVDSKLSIVKIDVTFRCIKDGTTILVHHGIQTDDPEAEIYCLAGSTASLMEIA